MGREVTMKSQGSGFTHPLTPSCQGRGKFYFVHVKGYTLSRSGLPTENPARDRGLHSLLNTGARFFTD